MKRAYFNCILLDGTEQMEPVAHKMVLADGEKIKGFLEQMGFGFTEEAPVRGMRR